MAPVLYMTYGIALVQPTNHRQNSVQSMKGAAASQLHIEQTCNLTIVSMCLDSFDEDE